MAPNLPPVSEALAAEARAAAALAAGRVSVTTRVFAMLVPEVLAARARGDYAIAAGLHVPSTGVLHHAANELFSRRDPAGHAELLVLRRHAGVAAGSDRTLYTTMEPCPMCTVAIINSGVRRVVVARADPASGAMLDGRLDLLPPVWPRLAAAQGLSAVLAEQDDPQHPHHLDPRVAAVLCRLFDESQAALDRVLAGGGDGAPPP